MRKLMSLMALFVVSLLAFSMVGATLEDGLTIEEVEINGDEVTAYDAADMDTLTVDGIGDDPETEEIETFPVDGLTVEEGETLDIEVHLAATADVKDIQVEVDIRGYEYNDYESLDDETHMFDMHGTESAPSRKTVDLSVDLPRQLDEDRYLLRIRVTDKDNIDFTRYVVLQVEPVRHGLDIADVSLSRSSVKAGHSLLASVLLENFGERNQDDVKVTVAIPALGVSATEYLDVDADEREDVIELFLPIPATAEAGDYEVKVTARYDDLRETVSQTYLVTVTANEQFQTSDKLVLAIGPESQTVSPGQVATYGVALTNAGTSSQAYLLEVATGDWATATLSDSLIVLEPGKNQVVYVNLAVADNAAIGEHVASVVVKSGDDVLETVALKAGVVQDTVVVSNDLSLRSGLEIALIVLVVLLVVIGLIIGFSRLRRDDGEDQTYY